MLVTQEKINICFWKLLKIGVFVTVSYLMKVNIKIITKIGVLIKQNTITLHINFPLMAPRELLLESQQMITMLYRSEQEGEYC